MHETLLQLKSVTKNFGGVIANNDISFEIGKGEIVGLVGPNGCGKTTLFNCITGFNPPSKGEIYFEGKNIAGLAPSKVCKLGIARTFQLVKALPTLTVVENVMIGALSHTNDVAKARKKAEEVIEFINFPTLTAMKNSPASDLTTIDKKVLEIMRAYATSPKLLMLDEVMAGLNPSEVVSALDIIRNIRAQGVTLVVIEHLMQVIMNISDRVIVMEAGKKLIEGSPEKVVHDEHVIKAYLGANFHAKNK